MRKTEETAGREAAAAGALAEGRRPSVAARGEGERLDVLGDRQTVRLTGDETEGRFALIENENPPGTALPLHLHRREDEAFYVLEGRVDFTVDGERVPAGAGSTVFVPRGVPHTWEVVGAATARMLIMLFPAGLEGYFRKMSALAANGPPDMERVAALSEEYGIEILEAGEAPEG